MDEDHIAWHPAFAQALELTFEDYLDVLRFETEYPLTARPLQIDVLIIKQEPKAVIANPIAGIFRSHNLFEFKSPVDYLSVDGFYKGLIYGFSYKTKIHADIRDISVSFVVPHYPREVMKELRRIPGYTISEGSAGITVISAFGLLMQIIETKKLSSEENLYLSHLRDDLDAQKFQRVLTEVEKSHKVGIDAYMNVLSRANAEVLREVLMKNPTFDQVIEELGLAAKWEAQGEVRGEARGRREGEACGRQAEQIRVAKNLKRIGVPLNQIAEALELSVEEVIGV